MNPLLIDEPPLIVLPGLAAAIGLNEAMVLQQLHFLLRNPKNGKIVSGSRHIFNTYEEWKKHFPFLSVPTIKRTFRKLERLQLVVSIQPDRYRCDHRKYYRINYQQVDDVATRSSVNSGQTKTRSSRSHRSDQINLPPKAHFDPPNMQREKAAEEDPPTPEPSSGGFSYLPGNEDRSYTTHSSTPGGSTIAGGKPVGRHRTNPSDDYSAKRNWAMEAGSHPVAAEFLALVGLTAFPIGGRQPLARAFVKACESGKIALDSLRLIGAVRSRINLPLRPDRLIHSFNSLADDARDAALQRLAEIGRDRLSTGSDTQDLLRKMAAVEQQLEIFGPENLLSRDFHLPFPRWLCIAVCVKAGVAAEAWMAQCKPQMLEELSQDPSAVMFLKTFGLSLPDLGITEADLQKIALTRAKVYEHERGLLDALLSGDSSHG